MKVLKKSEFLRTPWKNGLGHSDQIAIHPPGAALNEDFIWRLSLAKIDQNSAFSRFPDHDRTLVILSGEGIRLLPQMITLAAFSAYEFSGDAECRCELLSGPVQDLSVFARKGKATSKVTPTLLSTNSAYTWRPKGRWNFALAVDTDFLAEQEDGKSVHVAQADCLYLESTDRAPKTLTLRNAGPGNHMVLVELKP